MVEFGLVLPLFIMLLVGIITLGMGVYFQQQVTNAAREAARFAAIHSASAQCPTLANLPPDAPPDSWYECPEGLASARWPQMTAHARSHIFGLNPSAVQLSACWSGYWTKDPSSGAYLDYDALPAEGGIPNEFRNCTIRSDDPGAGPINIDPRTDLWIDPASGDPIDWYCGPPPDNISCGVVDDHDQKPIACTAPMPLTDATNDMASSMSASYEGISNEVTAFACYEWTPPLAGFLLIPSTVTLRAVVTEALQYQQ